MRTIGLTGKSRCGKLHAMTVHPAKRSWHHPLTAALLVIAAFIALTLAVITSA